MTEKAGIVERLINMLGSIVTLWPLAVSVVGSIVAASATFKTSFSPDAHLLIAAAVFPITLWSLIGLIWLVREIRPSQLRIAFDCAYGMSLERLALGKDEDTPDAALQLGIVLRNAANIPLKYAVEQIELIVGTTAIPKPNLINSGGVISRGCESTYYYPPFPRVAIQPRVKAVFRFTIAYGHPDYGPSRRMTRHLDVSLRLDDKPGAVYLTEVANDVLIPTK